MNLKTIEKTILDGKELSEDERKHLLRKIDDFWEDHPDVVNRYPRWKKFMAWVAGYQTYDYNRVTKKLVPVPLKRKRKIVFNKMRSFVRGLLAKLVADIPQPGVIPNTTDDEDVEAARVGEKLIDGLSHKLDIARQTTDMKLWLIVCNRAYLRVFWNKDDSGIIGYQNEAELGDEFEEDSTESEERIVPVLDDGDIGIESISPFNCRVDPLHFSRKKWRWFIYGEEVDAEALESEYGLASNSLSESGDNVLDTAYDLELQDEQDIIIGGSDKADDISGRTIVAKEFWTPEIYVYAAGNEILEARSHNYGEIPFFVAEERLIPIESYEKGFTYNESIIKDVIPVQREYNRQMSLMSLALDRASKVKIMTPLGSLLSKQQWTNDFGTFIDYNPKAGQPPFQMKLDPLPSFLPEYKNDLEREFESMFYMHEASFGRLPERASHASGTLVSLLLEQDDVVLSPLLQSVNAALGGAWSLALKIIQEQYTVGRIVQYTGEGGDPAVMKFRGADIRGNTDVHVVSQTGLPKSRALRIEYVMRLREAGLLTDDKQVLEMLEFGKAEKVFEDGLIHERSAYRENALIKDNPELDPEQVGGFIHSLEDSRTHMKIHLRDRFSPKFDKYTPQQRAALENHLQATNKKIQQEIEAEMQRMARMKELSEGQTQGESQ